jgi:hypothetical protein
LCPSVLSTVIRITKVRPSSVTLRLPGDSADRGAAAGIALVAAAASRGRRGLWRLGLDRRQQRGDARMPELADRRQRAVEEARRLGAIELGVGRQTKAIDHAADQEFRLNDLELTLDRAQVERIDARQRRLGADHLEGAGVEHDARRGLIHRRRLGDDQRHQRDRQQAGAG